jgi:hypothetical protein
MVWLLPARRYFLLFLIIYLNSFLDSDTPVYFPLFIGRGRRA